MIHTVLIHSKCEKCLPSGTVSLGYCRSSKSFLGVRWGWGHKSVKLTVSLSSVLFNQCCILLRKCVHLWQIVYVCLDPGCFAPVFTGVSALGPSGWLRTPRLYVPTLRDGNGLPFVTHDPYDPSHSWPMTHMTDDRYNPTHGSRRGRGMVVLDNPLSLESKKIVD